ncbi:hypothetical protein QJS10_CPA10g01493 [Acorus calamus]|uniref:Uncharacterized protein n=1 Tax=Acorus calamus TaxID=4465 RepID=A0AAV9E1B4_ACOCL|nr:hypothetical protein QJS10_CPA10g01493 [Acorus calamus]
MEGMKLKTFVVLVVLLAAQFYGYSQEEGQPPGSEDMGPKPPDLHRRERQKDSNISSFTKEKVLVLSYQEDGPGEGRLVLTSRPGLGGYFLVSHQSRLYHVVYALVRAQAVLMA